MSARRFEWVPASLLVTSGPVQAQQLAGGADAGPSGGRVLAALVLCLLVAAAAALVLRWQFGLRPALLQGRPSGRRMRLVEVMRLNQQTQLCIVSCDDRELLLSASPAGAQILETLSPSSGRSGARADP